MAGEKAPEPVDRYEAARRTRLLVRSTREHLAVLINGHSDRASYVRRIKEARRLSDHKEENIQTSLRRLRAEIPTRRVSGISGALDVLVMHMGAKNVHDRDQFLYTNRLFDLIGMQDEKTNLSVAKKKLDEIAVLIQSLPTVDEMPESNAENVLRAIIATLRYSGIPGTENLQWKEVLGSAEKKNNDAEHTAGSEDTPEAEADDATTGTEGINLAVSSSVAF